MDKAYQRRYKFANLANVILFVIVVAGVSMLYGKLQMLQSQSAGSQDDRDRLRQHETDLSKAQSTISTLTSEIEALRKELEAARKSNAPAATSPQ